MRAADKWSYLKVLSRKSLSDERRLALTFMDYTRQTEVILGILNSETSLYSPEMPEPGVKCLSCGEPLDVGNLYCGEFCKDVAKFVRYVRACQADGRILKIDIQEAIGSRILQLNGGGYPERERLIPSTLREAIFSRDNGKCVLCGKTATEIDHIDGSSNDQDNLRAICGPCNRKRAFGESRPASSRKQRAFIQALWDDLAVRIIAPLPIYVCDDEAEWKSRWQALKATARQAKREVRA